MRIVFIGTGAIGLPVLRFLQQSADDELVGIVTQPDKPVGRAQVITAPPIKAAFAQSELPILQPARIKNVIDDIRALAPDVIVVMAYGQILPPSLLEIPPVACLNLHSSLLPRWRGAAPIQAAIAAGDRETGITVMHMDAGLDTGDILLEQPLPIAADETGSSLHDKLAELAPIALGDALARLREGRAPRQPQESSAATHAPKLERADGLIDWGEDATTIERKIRAFDPWPGAFTQVSSKGSSPHLLKIFRARPLPESGRPGSLLHLDDEVVIAAGEGSLLLESVQLAGKRRMSGAEFARGFSAPFRISH